MSEELRLIIERILEQPDFLIVATIVIAIVISRALRDDVLRVFRLFLYRDSSNAYGNDESDELERLREKIRDIEKDIAGSALKNKRKIIDGEIDRYIEANLSDLLEKKVSAPEVINNSVLKSINAEVRAEIEKTISGKSLEELQKASALSDEHRSVQRSHDSLLEMLEREARNASMLKMVMINLFVVSTVAFLIFNIFNRETLPTNAYIAVLGIYFSLGAFMLYIIRTSHFRSSVLLAIKEDERNYRHSIEYIQKTRNGEAPTEHDVELIRMIMTNRSERENKANHPYEVIMKGVSGTNVQFKGGKINLGNQGDGKA